MVVTREDINPCTVQLNVVCDSAQVHAGFEKAFKQIAKKVKLPGFRPGHAPRSILEPLVSKEELYEEAADYIFKSTYRPLLEQEKIEPDTTTRPRVEMTKLERDENVAEYTVKVPLPPKVELGDYKGLPVEGAETQVSDEEIDRQIDEFRKGRSKREVVTDRGVQEGDVAVVNIKPEGAEGDGRVFMIVVGQTKFPELDSALIDMKLEEMKNLSLSFPETFQDKEWSGKSFNAQITVNSLSAVQLPDVDDAFAKSLQSENLTDLRNRLTELIGQAKIQMSRDMMIEKLLDTLHDRSKIYVSDNMWEELANRRLVEQSEEQQKQGKSLETYAKENGMTLEELVDSWRDKAKLHVERALMIREIFTAEEMQLTNQELNQELHIMASEYQVEAEEMLKLLQSNNALDELHYRSISRKVSDFLLANADIQAPGALEAPSEVAPPKKSSAKKTAAKESSAHEPSVEEVAPEKKSSKKASAKQSSAE
jgi:trigger factor